MKLSLHRYTRKSVDSVMIRFLQLMRQSQISKSESELFLSFINSILPVPHVMPRNMNILLEQMNIANLFTKRTVCILCRRELVRNKSRCDECPTAESKHVAHILDTHLPSLLKIIVPRLALEIEAYKKIISNGNSHLPYDIPIGKRYKSLLRQYPGQNLLSLILHIDGVGLVKSSNMSLWVCNASIVELPPETRVRRSNIVLLSMYIGYSEPNPMLWLDSCFLALDQLKRKG